MNLYFEKIYSFSRQSGGVRYDLEMLCSSPIFGGSINKDSAFESLHSRTAQAVKVQGSWRVPFAFQGQAEAHAKEWNLNQSRLSEIEHHLLLNNMQVE